MSTEKKKPILVNGEEVDERLVEQELQFLCERYAREMSPEEMDKQRAKIESDARENAVERVLLMQKAKTEIKNVRPEEVEARFVGLMEQHGGAEEFKNQFKLKPEEENEIRADMEDGVRVEKYFDQICANIDRPVEADLRAYYAEHAEAFKVPELVHAAHIVQHPSPDLPLEKIYAELLNVRERLKNGENFDALAGEYSHSQEGGHDLGYFARGQLVQALEAVAFETKVGDYSDVFQSEFGYHILTVLDQKPATVQAYDEVRHDIESLLFDERKNSAIGVVADELRAVATIENLEIFKI